MFGSENGPSHVQANSGCPDEASPCWQIVPDTSKSLLAADPAVIHTAPTFFGLSAEGSLELAQLAIARIYDRAARAVTVRRFLHAAATQLTTFQRATPVEASDAILEAVRTVIALQPIVDAIRKRRDEWLAHLDPKTVADPSALSAKAKLSIPDLDRAFSKTEEMLLGLSSLYKGVVGQLRFIGGDDYKMALD